MSDGFQIGPVYIYYYGVIIMIGALAALWLALREAKHRDLDPEIIWDVVPWLLIAGIIGARLWHVFTPSKSMGAGGDYYLSNPIEILMVRKGGFGNPGGILGGVLGLVIFLRKKESNFLTLAGGIIPGGARGQGSG
ncbi:MAG TPA: prolipoprotein diacylglyceryl transferase, partial [Anaerolineaceae bacterium]|nr:prolipoprotein diacylglyceryl transferase [Anaerolineaceae bacterium]